MRIKYTTVKAALPSKIGATPDNEALILIEASSFWARLRGLIGRTLPRNHGVLFRHCGSLHTCFMSMAIDVFYLDDNGTIISIVRGLKPWRLSMCHQAVHFIEIPSTENYPVALGQIFPLTRIQDYLS